MFLTLQQFCKSTGFENSSQVTLGRKFYHGQEAVLGERRVGRNLEGTVFHHAFWESGAPWREPCKFWDNPHFS